ncbi:MAG: hypothetical protein E7612_09535 [Ruminococcaceae bacterium]|nr:hypothetical protein [Oscillospiraceae bacterium]
MFGAITLEVSLKPFKKTDEEYIRRVAREIFVGWRPLLKNREEISVMLWASDGSEILDYDGDMSREFEWGYYLGTANNPQLAEDEDPAISLHERKQPYIENPPKMTYEVLRNIIRILKEEGRREYPDSKIRVGETFDIGPEFAVSEFKYKRHTEICSGTELDCKLKFVDSTSLLNADSRKYAAYPDGIPEGEPFATFFAKQTKCFFADMRFDYLWLSNGLGFSADPWSLTGKIFDGEKFYPEKLGATSKKVFDFWRLFRESCPDIPIETRGTNNSAGIDYSTDGVALYDIYNADFGIMPPPNSPWAAINGNYGLEIMGHMTRICELPGKDFLFRYYLHDPWWMNSPWYDRYDGYPTDVYLPMGVSRICEDGGVQSATRFNILSIDNSLGDMPDSCINESVPHILKAEKDSADEPSAFVWLYPLREYTTAKTEKELSEMHKCDVFMMNAINCGFPLNTVVSSDIFKKTDKELYSGRVIVAPVIRDEEVTDTLKALAEKGEHILLYGTEEVLSECGIFGKNVTRVSVDAQPTEMLKSLSRFGYCVVFKTRENVIKLPVWNAVRSNNGTFFSVYNPDTTTDTLMKFPLGAPVMLGGECEIVDGYAKYRFSRCEHRECRIFVEQKEGVISAYEQAPVSAKYRRRFRVDGLSDATVYYFPEKYCDKYMAASTEWEPDPTPVLDGGWTPIYDSVFGNGFKAEHKSGGISFLMPFEKYINED